MKNESGNPLLCDVESGLCELPSTHDNTQGQSIAAGPKPIRVIYFTDPICSSCWGIEPPLRKLKLAYGHLLEFDYRMGGLLPDWSYNSSGINKPSDVAHHWDEVSVHYDMPIDGDVWLEDPLSSSYPPSIAFKAAQWQHRDKAILFLRALREMVFLQKKNINKWEYIAQAAAQAGLDSSQLKTDYAGYARTLFAGDLELARQLGVRGFPTMFFVDSVGRQEKVYGSRTFADYVSAIRKLQPLAQPYPYQNDWQHLFAQYPSLTTREFTELSGIPRSDWDKHLNTLHEAGILHKLTTKNGVLWQLKGSGDACTH
ncbi:DsbA family protein [Paraflavitalea sp. CAU 1676]|uniref:DsbA family protein n=1 Tax=Paraflavitalea sp. CAU 1676 TaxID=3032598 RepID=UPI0023DBAACD|nr:DsbA family protein [Paraflavitalea sp. CAU 1676]MDF2188446.1 DsbA family protein [Paraflavitalea sp. CAU 1676]